jgi:hypothetical protein
VGNTLKSHFKFFNQFQHQQLKFNLKEKPISRFSQIVFKDQLHI